MRQVPTGMQAQLDAGATTFCNCWRIDPAHVAPLGFTDHDDDLAFDGIVFEAASGFEATGIERSLGLSIDNGAASGALRSDKIREIDIRKGVYDGAVIRQWLVDWRNPSDRLLNFRGEIGEIRRGAVAFEVELRGLAEKLNRPVGRNYLSVCDAELGDARCAAVIETVAFKGVGVVAGVLDARTILVSGLGGYAVDWFTDGRLRWSGGANAGLEMGVRAHRKTASGVELAMDRDLIEAPAPGDGFAVYAGCDKRLATCRSKFSNTANFRGFPYIPGETWMAAYPVDGDVHDGGSLRNG